MVAAHVPPSRHMPDRVAGCRFRRCQWSCRAAGSRFELIGGVMTSFYDWYADFVLVASPQVFGDQTDVPESGDWRDASWLGSCGAQRPDHPDGPTHIGWRRPVTAAPKSLSSFDYADNTKFADLSGCGAAGTDTGDGDGPRDPVGMLRP